MEGSAENGTVENDAAISTSENAAYAVLLAKSQKAQDIKIYVIPYFLKIYEELFAELDKIKDRTKTEVDMTPNSTIQGVSSPPQNDSYTQAMTEYNAAKKNYDDNLDTIFLDFSQDHQSIIATLVNAANNVLKNSPKNGGTINGLNGGAKTEELARMEQNLKDANKIMAYYTNVILPFIVALKTLHSCNPQPPQTDTLDSDDSSVASSSTGTVHTFASEYTFQTGTITDSSLCDTAKKIKVLNDAIRTASKVLNTESIYAKTSDDANSKWTEEMTNLKIFIKSCEEEKRQAEKWKKIEDMNVDDTFNDKTPVDSTIARLSPEQTKSLDFRELDDSTIQSLDVDKLSDEQVNIILQSRFDVYPNGNSNNEADIANIYEEPSSDSNDNSTIASDSPSSSGNETDNTADSSSTIPSANSQTLTRNLFKLLTVPQLTKLKNRLSQSSDSSVIDSINTQIVELKWTKPQEQAPVNSISTRLRLPYANKNKDARKLTPEQILVALRDGTKRENITSDEIKRVGVMIQYLEPEHFANLTTTQLNGLTKDQVISLTYSQIDTLGYNNIQGLDTSKLSRTQIDYLYHIGKSEPSWLSDKQKTEITKRRKELNPVNLDPRYPSLMTNIEPEQFNSFKKEQVEQLTREQIMSLPSLQLNSLITKWIGSLSESQINAIDFSNIQNLQTISILEQNVKKINSANIRVFLNRAKQLKNNPPTPGDLKIGTLTKIWNKLSNWKSTPQSVDDTNSSVNSPTNSSNASLGDVDVCLESNDDLLSVVSMMSDITDDNSSLQEPSQGYTSQAQNLLANIYGWLNSNKIEYKPADESVTVDIACIYPTSTSEKSPDNDNKNAFKKMREFTTQILGSVYNSLSRTSANAAADAEKINWMQNPLKSKSQPTSQSGGNFGSVIKGGATKREIKEMIDFVHRILLDLNMYANPEYLDRIYHGARLLGLNMFENFNLFGKKTNSSKKKMMDKRIGANYQMREYFLGQDPDTKVDNYEMTFEVEPYGIDAETRTENLFKYVFNAKKPFEQKRVPSNKVDKPIEVHREGQVFMEDVEPEPINLNSTEELVETPIPVISPNPKNEVRTKTPKKLLKRRPIRNRGGAPPQNAYRYLEDSLLCRHFEDCVEESVESCKVHLCVFSIDHSCSLNDVTYPFLKFIVRPQPKDAPDFYEFISFPYNVPDNDSTEDFKCALYENLLTELDLSLTTDSFECASASQILDSIYKGIKSEEIDGQHHVFAFFDFDAILAHSSVLETPVLENPVLETPVSGGGDGEEIPVSDTKGFVRGAQFPSQISDDNLSTPYRWAIIDELLFERKLYGIHEVDPVIPVVFYKNNILWSIFEGESETPVDFPFSVYSVAIKETEDGNERFDNVRVPLDQQTAELRQESVVLPPEIDVYGQEDEYGHRFCFTYLPFKDKVPEEETPLLPKRYAVITSNPIYLDSSSPLKGDQEEEGNTDSETQSTEDIDSDSVKKLTAPVIYFVANNEYTDSKPVVMWGIKQSSQFVAL